MCSRKRTRYEHISRNHIFYPCKINLGNFFFFSEKKNASFFHHPNLKNILLSSQLRCNVVATETPRSHNSIGISHPSHTLPQSVAHRLLACPTRGRSKCRQKHWQQLYRSSECPHTPATAHVAANYSYSRPHSQSSPVAVSRSTELPSPPSAE